MPRYRSESIGDLARNLSFLPEERRSEQLVRLERVLRDLDSSHPYTFSFLHVQVTGLRPAEAEDVQIEGDIARRDLALLLHDLSSTLSLPASDVEGTLLTVGEVKEMYDVSESTISRWRGEGLICKKYVFARGKRKTGILQKDLRAFIEENAHRIHKSANLAPLGLEAKRDLVHRARVLVAREGMGLSQVSLRIADDLQLPVETILYTLKRHDEEHLGNPIFPDALLPLTEECKRKIFCLYNSGELIEDISRKYRRGRSTIYRIVRQVKAEAILKAKTEYIYNPIFEHPDADKIILAEGLPTVESLAVEDDERLPGSPEQPAYLKDAGRVPLLAREEEVDLFRRYNYVKYKLAREKRNLKPSEISNEKLQEIADLEAMGSAVKNRIIEANLRLVISIAKKYVKPQSSFSELVSDGNVSLMRAVEKFDYSRGIRFSTYASWAIMKNFAKTIPEETSQLDRFSTGKQEILEVFPDPRENARQRAEFLVMLKHVVEELLEELSEREKDILISRFGIEDGEAHTLEQVGEEFSVTRERVRQIEHRALQKLRDMVGERHLNDLE